MWYKLKKIYIYPDGVTEKQVYPAWWQPWAYTVAYFPFKDDQLDKVGSATLSLSWTKQTLWYLFNTTSSNNPIYNLNTNTPFVSFYAKFGSAKSSAWNQTVRFYKWWFTYWYYNPTSSFSKHFYYNTGSRVTWWEIQTSSWQWYHFAYWYTGTNLVAYVNWNQIMNTPASLSNQWNYIYLCDNIEITYSELIFESTVWSAQEVSDYYNNTKSNYWL